MADAAAIETTVTNVVADFGRLDIVVANAGVGAEIDAIDYSPSKYRELMAVNLDGAFYTAQAAAKVFKSQGSGNIIFTTSISAVIVNRPENQAVVGLFLSFYHILCPQDAETDKVVSTMHPKLALYILPRVWQSNGSTSVG